MSQENYPFSGTVAENLRYGMLDASDEAVQEAARVVEAHEFIRNLEDGYDTEVGEEEVKLSGGQRHRIAIARVVFSGPLILIFDTGQGARRTEDRRPHGVWVRRWTRTKSASRRRSTTA